MPRAARRSFTQEVLLHIVNAYIRDRFDFFYLPIDFRTQCNLGYCYINVVDTDTVRDLYRNVGVTAGIPDSLTTNIGPIRPRRRPARSATRAFRWKRGNLGM